MRRKSASILAIVVAAAFQWVIADPALAEDAQTQAVRGEIQKELDKVMQMYRHGASGLEIADALYEDDAAAIGEGENGLYRGRKSFESVLVEHVEEERSCTMSIADPLRYSGNLASAYVVAHCPDTKPAEHVDARMLMVFHKGKKGWRVIQEMYIWGPL